ncbi:crossover junction endodeoxyribonuclease RuvC [Candidatus Daviesbacteria bacterium RIFCSPLOWO2_01_FULL_43_38]|uniref:Crossover junction endodeoxyribonuclease RuvC n=2 Tax=Candidatus Daviesiibacteriota TaxID=1752718 RepID=A0A1F5K2I8_9BACT|nr:MAG: Crossover junction endodeoxyribonuclease RuvC [Candidatus Daviesbacteria bacterium GW2011_GWA2_42_7]OGE20506.1 MAG: crossover junction endodeoxyribonuclease RuvC [Candidatus Daviesbacteria bacterium RIFCSPHIGHO2_01_FULL_43_17]OGE35119.1 MAG: crossover junction endodeoxyribonuclease RuvC [Candidatus Daviesbacteria bacterium RIFCSPHIGHO2_12_FULL_43_11]OGE63257.1 MAG: crossover junction endodeoxyribonuclease RuvC [Candidatus Daviesbacteria bacterium RIFCSPLOWO2_01_FULL_43_38]OGE70655.1 MAG
MIILGIDPGTATTGYGLIKVPDDILGREFDYGIELITYGNISTSKDHLAQDRLLQIHRELKGVIAKYKPELIVIELLFFGANTRTAIAVGQARGVIMLAAAEYRVPIHEYTGPQVKLMVAGSGRADKNQVHDGVRKFLGTPGRRKNKLKVNWKGGHLDDATDALAIAICHVLKLAAK